MGESEDVKEDPFTQHAHEVVGVMRFLRTSTKNFIKYTIQSSLAYLSIIRGLEDLNDNNEFVVKQYKVTIKKRYSYGGNDFLDYKKREVKVFEFSLCRMATKAVPKMFGGEKEVIQEDLLLRDHFSIDYGFDLFRCAYFDNNYCEVESLANIRDFLNCFKEISDSAEIYTTL